MYLCLFRHHQNDKRKLIRNYFHTLRNPYQDNLVKGHNASEEIKFNKAIKHPGHDFCL